MRFSLLFISFFTKSSSCFLVLPFSLICSFHRRPTTTPFQYVEVSTMGKSVTQRQLETKPTQIRSLHPHYLVNNHEPTNMSPNNTAAISGRTIATRLVISTAPQSPCWDNLIQPQTQQHVAYYRLVFRSFNDRLIHPLHTYALRLVCRVSSSTIHRLIT